MTVFNPQDFARAAQALCDTGRILYQRGWSPATSSNYSVRLNEQCCALTRSGKHKDELTPADMLGVDWQGQPLTNGKPSAETLLHTQLYQRDAGIGAVLHTHSPVTVVLSQIWPQEQLSISGWELQKAFAGETTHDATLNFPLFANDQDIPRRGAHVEGAMQQQRQGHAYLRPGHGVYTWRKDLTECSRHLEALENLLGYQQELLKVRRL